MPEAFSIGECRIYPALGDSARNPRYIQTVPKRGYRLLASVDSVSDEVGIAPLKGKRWAYYFAVGLALVIGAVITAYILPGDGMETSADLVTAPDKSPDGLPTLTVQPFTLIGLRRFPPGIRFQGKYNAQTDSCVSMYIYWTGRQVARSGPNAITGPSRICFRYRKRSAAISHQPLRSR